VARIVNAINVKMEVEVKKDKEIDYKDKDSLQLNDKFKPFDINQTVRAQF
jgi:hypothetical protein